MKTTETRFSTGITRYEPRRRWARPAVMVLLVALLLWLMSGGVFGAESASLAEMGPTLGVPPPESVLTYKAWQQGIVIGLGAAAIMAFTWCVALKVRRDDEAALEKSRGCARVRPTNRPPAPEPVDPLGLPFLGIDLASMIRITEALMKQTENAAIWVRSAQQTLCRHEQEDMLRLALRELQPVNACLPELKKALEKQQQTGGALV